MTAAFHYEILGSPLHDRNHLVDVSAAVVGRLRELEGVGSPASASMEIPYAIVVGTGGTEAQIIERWRTRQASNEGEPALLIAHRGDNSLASALEALAYIHQVGGRGRIVMADRLGDVARAILDQTAYLKLQNARVGLVGEPSDWLIASSPSAEVVRRRWGPTVVPLSTTTLISGSSNGVAVTLGRRWANVDVRGDVAVDEMERAAAIHEPLVDLIDEFELDAVSVRCFDLLETVETSGCVALAELNGTGTVAGCEGDMASTLAMMWAREMFGSASWMANPARVDPDVGEIELAHCTVARTLVEEIELTTHFESGIGIGVSGRFRRQPVCLIRIGGADLDKVWLADGEIVASGHSVDLCRTQATVLVQPDKARELLDRPLGNHVVLVPGHHADRLRAYWKLYVEG